MAKTRRRGYPKDERLRPEPKYGRRGNARHHYTSTRDPRRRARG